MEVVFWYFVLLLKTMPLIYMLKYKYDKCFKLFN